MQKNKKIIIAVLFLLAFLERTVFDIGPNFELLTTALILSSYFLNRNYAFVGTFLVLALSDRIIGNSKIFIFTWSGFLIPALFSTGIINRVVRLTDRLKNKFRLPLILTVTGFSANIFFFVWTNLGVWLLDSFGMYTKDLAGLIRCFVNGLPFLKNQMVSSLLFIPLGFLVINYFTKLSLKYSSNTQRSLFDLLKF